MATKLGEDFLLYHDTSANNGTSAWTTPTWVLQNGVGDMTFDRAPKSVEVKSRSTKHTKYKQGRFDQRLSVTVNYDPASAFVTALEAAVAAQTHLHLAIADGAIATGGTNYWHADYCIVGDPLSAALDDGATFEVELAPWADSVNEPIKVTV
jgi:hypothetical protein